MHFDRPLHVPLLVLVLFAASAGCSTNTPPPQRSAPPAAPAPSTGSAGEQRQTGQPDRAAPPQYPPRFVIMERTWRGGKPVDKYGYIDQTGRVVIAPQLDAAEPFSEGLALAQIGERRAFINTDGALAFRLPERTGEVGAFREGLALVRAEAPAPGGPGGKWGYVGRDGGFAISPRFVVRAQDVHKLLERGHFNEGLAAVPDAFGRWGYIDRQGEWVIRPQFDSAMPFREGLGAVHLDPGGATSEAAGAPEGKWGYVDRTGKMVWMFNPSRSGVPASR